MAKENPRWGYETISSILKMAHIKVSASSVKNILDESGIPHSKDSELLQKY